MATLPEDEINALKKNLNAEQLHVCFGKGTEPSFSGAYHDHKADGRYLCVCCGLELFDSVAKYDSGSGWPSFYSPMDKGGVIEEDDNSLLMMRTEVLCSQCESHLGHVFPDGPQPTGLRYCINSASLNFQERRNK